MPDPSSLDADGDDDIPLSVVKEKQNLERRESVRKASIGQAAAARPVAPPPTDLMGADPVPQRPSTTGPSAGQVPAKAQHVPPKTTSTKDSLLGLDFLGTETTAPPRPASTTGTTGASGQSRPDLKQSILSLYATAPRPQPPPQQVSHSPSHSFGALQSPGQQTQGSFGGGLNDAFSSLSFGGPSQAKSPQRDAFAGLGGLSSSRPTPPTNNPTFPSLSGGSFFDPKPTPPASAHEPRQSMGSPGAFGALASPTAPAAPKPAPVPASSALGDLFDFSSTAPQPSKPSPPVATTAATNSVFNLSANQTKAPEPVVASTIASTNSNWSNADIWGGNAWTTTEAPKKSPEILKSPGTAPANSFGWGAPTNPLANQSIVPGASGGFATKVAADEEFGGWTSGTGVKGGESSKPAGTFGTGEDLFSNVWE